MSVGGDRYNRETLAVKYKGKSIADLLDTSVEEALSLLENLPQINQKLQTLLDVGLGYIKLGQSSNYVVRWRSAGESNSRRNSQNGRPDVRIYILDEPTTGLHFADVPPNYSTSFNA
jgi:excinuclease ABC subunit A